MKDETRIKANELADKIKDYKGRINALNSGFEVRSSGFLLTRTLSKTTTNVIKIIIESELTEALKTLEQEMESL